MGYYEEKKKYEESINPKLINQEVNHCPKCKKGILTTTITTNASFKRKRFFSLIPELKRVYVYISFCSRCGNTIRKEVPI